MTKVNLVEELDVGGSGSRVDMDEVVVGVNGNGAGNGISKADADEDEQDDDEEVEELPEPEKEEQDQAHGDMYLDTVSLYILLSLPHFPALTFHVSLPPPHPGRPAKPSIRFRTSLLQIPVESKRLLLFNLRQVFPRSREGELGV